MTSTEQEALLRAAQSGDRAAAQTLLESQRPLLQRYLAARTRSTQDAEDLTQDVLRRAYLALPQYRGQGAFSAWIFAIAATQLTNYYARTLPQNNRAHPISDLNKKTSPDVKRDPQQVCPYDRVELEVLIGQLLTAATRAGCTREEQEVLELVYQEATYEEIGLVLAMPQERARLHFLRGRIKLLAYLVRSEPDLLGGRAAIETAWRQACSAADPGARPTQQEQHAWENPNGRVKQFRSAVMKLARCLPVPAAVLALLWGGSR